LTYLFFSEIVQEITRRMTKTSDETLEYSVFNPKGQTMVSVKRAECGKPPLDEESIDPNVYTVSNLGVQQIEMKCYRHPIESRCNISSQSINFADDDV